MLFRSTLAEARATIAKDADASIFAPRLVDIAAVQAELGDRKQARATIEAAVASIEGIEDAVTKAGLLAKAGVVYGSKSGGLGDATAGKKTLAAAAEVAGDVPERFRAQALAAVALGYADAGLIDAAAEMIETLESTARALDEPRPQAEALARRQEPQRIAYERDEVRSSYVVPVSERPSLSETTRVFNVTEERRGVMARAGASVSENRVGFNLITMLQLIVASFIGVAIFAFITGQIEIGGFSTRKTEAPPAPAPQAADTEAPAVQQPQIGRAHV